MKENCSYKILRHFGWTPIFNTPLPAKCVICIAPHTSNWDFIVGILFKKAYKIKASFFMKHEWFRFPLGYMMKSLGGIPVYRDKSHSMTDAMAKEFENHDELHIALTPEGTRSYNPDWKKGFYYIAQKAQVPIMLAYIDFKKKEVGFDRIFNPTGDIEKDMTEIKDYYRNISAKYPEKFGL